MRHCRYLALCLLLTGCSPTEEPATAVTDAPLPGSDDAPAAAAPTAAPPAAFTGAALAAAAAISADPIRDAVVEIADDRYEGRGPGTEGDEMTRRWIASRLDAIGFEPAAPGGGWQQSFDLVGIDAAQPPTMTVSGADGSLTLEQGSEFIVSSGLQAGSVSVRDAELVFVGYGIEAPEYDWNDFKGADLKGKVFVMLNNDPHWDDALFAGERRLYYGRWNYKYESAARQRAAGAIIIHTDASAGYGWNVVQSSWSGPQFELPAEDEPRIKVKGWVTADAASRIAALAGEDLDALVAAARERDFAPVALGLTTSVELNNTLTSVTSANVLGVLRGSDPELADEVVIYTAHHDHLGVDPNAPEGADRIYNGARDNATGVGMLLAAAEAFAALPKPPRRSIVMAFVGAEEQGLLGSNYLARNPPVPAGRIAANVNLDSGNIWGKTRDITYVGMNKSTLDRVAKTVGAHQGRIVKPDQQPDKGFFYRSDQFNMARIGVPALYLKNGMTFVDRPAGWGDEVVAEHTRTRYHQVGDELTDDWDFSGMVEDTRFAFLAGLIVANEDELPAWYPGDEFEAARKVALDAL